MSGELVVRLNTVICLELASIACNDESFVRKTQTITVLRCRANMHHAGVESLFDEVNGKRCAVSYNL